MYNWSVCIPTVSGYSLVPINPSSLFSPGTWDWKHWFPQCWLTMGRNFLNKYSKWSVPGLVLAIHHPLWYYPDHLWLPLYMASVQAANLCLIWCPVCVSPVPDVLIWGHCPLCNLYPPSLWSRHQSMIISLPPSLHWDSLIQTQSATAGILDLTNRGQYK